MSKFRSAQQQCDTQLNAVRQETRAAIRQILTPQQNQQFDELVRRWDERHRRLSR
jgi:Spy/CpxP family protein refolding chaperone